MSAPNLQTLHSSINSSCAIKLTLVSPLPQVEKKQGELKQVLWEKPSATEAVEELSQGVEALRKTNMELRRQGAVSDGKRAKHKAQMKVREGREVSVSLI